MDTTKNLTTNDILNLLDDLEKVSSNEESLTITANSLDTIFLSDDYDWPSMAIQPLTTAQLAPILTTSGSGAGLTSTSPYVFANNWATVGGTINPSLTVKGSAEFEDDITIKGKSLSKILDGIEQRLAILHPNERLENDWEELKELGERYRELEAEIIAKEEMFKTLKH